MKITRELSFSLEDESSEEIDLINSQVDKQDNTDKKEEDDNQAAVEIDQITADLKKL
jgi:hypothetical protein